jgi:predicted nucleic acid-binding Zn ribbon protein
VAPGRRAPVRIAGPLEELLDALNLRDPMAGWKAVELWPEVVGARVAAHARATAFRDGVLYVEVDTAAWMNELAYLRRQMASDLNSRLGSERVTDIRLLPKRSGE